MTLQKMKSHKQCFHVCALAGNKTAVKCWEFNLYKVAVCFSMCFIESTIFGTILITVCESDYRTSVVLLNKLQKQEAIAPERHRDHAR